jgi:hypothetical protein
MVEFFTPYSYNEWRPAKTVTVDHKIFNNQTKYLVQAAMGQYNK